MLSLLEVPFAFGLKILRLYDVSSIVKLNWFDKAVFVGEGRSLPVKLDFTDVMGDMFIVKAQMVHD